MNKESAIGIFDSGIGGLTILKKIREFLPRENIIYYGDWKNNPYSEKREDEIKSFSREITEFLLRNNCKAIVVGCSIFSTASLDYLQKLNPNIIIVGMIDGGVSSAILESENQKIAVMGAEFVINSNIYEKKIKELDSKVTLYQIPCKKLCGMLEQGWENFSDRLEVLEGYLKNIPKDVDTLILGGTHYPIIKEDIKKFFPKKIVDSSIESVIELFKELGEKKLLREGIKKGKVEFYINGDRDRFREVAEKILEVKERINIFSIY